MREAELTLILIVGPVPRTQEPFDLCQKGQGHDAAHTAAIQRQDSLRLEIAIQMLLESLDRHESSPAKPVGQTGLVVQPAGQPSAGDSVPISAPVPLICTSL